MKLECLESRELLDGNVLAAIVAPGELRLDGNVDANSVDIWQGPNAQQFFVRGTAGTNTNLNGGSVLQEFNGVTSITVVLAGGGDTFNFLPKGTATGPGSGGATGQSVLGGPLVIENEGSIDVNTLTWVQLNTLTLGRDVSAGNSNLTISNSRVLGATSVDYTTSALGGVGGFDGGSYTQIQNTYLDGGLIIINGDGDDIVSVQGCYIVGDALTGVAASIDNADGRSRVVFTLFTGATPINEGGKTILVGTLDITTNTTDAAFLDTASLTGTEVRGPIVAPVADAVFIDNNGAARTQTLIGQDPLDTVPPGSTSPSNIGTDVVAGGPFTINNGSGYDYFLMLNSTAQWGLTIDNNVNAGGPSTAGSKTEITGSKISDFPIAAVGLNITGDNGNDEVTIQNTTVGQTTTIDLGAGLNTLSLSRGAGAGSVSQFDTLDITGGADKDVVTIEQTTVRVSTTIALAGGVDLVKIDAATTAAPFSTFVGALAIDGGDPVGTPDADKLIINTRVNLALANFLPTDIFTQFV